MSDPRVIKPLDFFRIRDLMNKELRKHHESDVFLEYPHVFNETNIQNIFAIYENNKPISCAGLFPMVYEKGNIKINFSAVSSVVTEEQHRGKGLARKIMDKIFSRARELSSDVVILWSDLFDFYAKFGYRLCGLEKAFTLDFNPGEIGREKAEIKEIYDAHNGLWKDMMEIYNNDKSSGLVIRTLETFIQLSNIPHTHYIVSYQGVKPKAYIVIGKGEDFPLHIHEWAGEPRHIMTLVHYAMKRYTPEVLTLIGPYTDHVVYDELLSLGAQQENRFLGLIKILEPDAFFRKFNIKRDNNVEPEIQIFGSPKEINNQVNKHIEFYLKGLDSV